MDSILILGCLRFSFSKLGLKGRRRTRWRDSEPSEGDTGLFHNESSQPESVTENTHTPLLRQRQALRAHKHSLSYNRMELPLWPHKQRDALWTLHKCLVLRGWTVWKPVEMGRYRGELPVPKSLVFMYLGQTNLTLSWALPRGKPLPLSLHHSGSFTDRKRQTFIHTLNVL